MERKVGEIFEYNEEWYQCIVQPKGTEGQSFSICSMNFGGKCPIHVIECAMEGRSDGKSVIFKKLKKVGEPEIINGKKVQSIVTGYVGCAFCIFKKGGACLSGGTCKNRGTRIYVEIKQNKEDMEEKKLNLKPFDLEAAKAGKPVCTRDGRKVRIISFDRKFLFKGVSYPIIALVEDTAKEETIYGYNEKGKVIIENDTPYKDDLMMLPQKKEGWVNVYKSHNVGKTIHCMASIYPTKEEAKKSSVVGFDYVDTVKIEWEE